MYSRSIAAFGKPNPRREGGSDDPRDPVASTVRDLPPARPTEPVATAVDTSIMPRPWLVVGLAASASASFHLQPVSMKHARSIRPRFACLRACNGLLSRPAPAFSPTRSGTPLPRLNAHPLRFATPTACASSSEEASEENTPPSSEFPRWLLVAMVFLHVLANAVIAQALPTALRRSFTENLVRTATTLGQLGSCAAFLDILISPQLGRLSDTIGRKPLLLGAPCVGFCVRAAAGSFATTRSFVAVKVLNGVISATYMVAVRAALADRFVRTDAATFTGRLGLVSASSCASYAIGMAVGGLLAARHLRYPYAVSAGLLLSLVVLIAVAFKETLPESERVPFVPREPGLGFLRLFRSGQTLRGLCSINALQQISISMGDTWQVFARELRGWGSEQCGLFGSLTGAGGMVASLLARSSVRKLGTRGHSLLAIGSVVVTELMLGTVTGSWRAFLALGPNWIGRTQQMAIVARMTNVATRQGFGQGALAGDRQNMHALIKIAGPMLYGSLFALGCKVGMPSLPFFFAATMGSIAWLLTLYTPRSVWVDEEDEVEVVEQGETRNAPAP